MAGRRKWSELRAKVAPEVLAEAAAKTEQMVASYRLRDLREARGLTQNQLTSIDHNVNGVATRGVVREQPPIPGSERDRQGE
jgi:hypothetical protein